MPLHWRDHPRFPYDDSGHKLRQQGLTESRNGLSGQVVAATDILGGFELRDPDLEDLQSAQNE
jgi:hypothetical protein